MKQDPHSEFYVLPISYHSETKKVAQGLNIQSKVEIWYTK